MNITVINGPRGCETSAAIRRGKAILGHGLTRTELRLMPYLFVCLMDRTSIRREHVSREELAILVTWEGMDLGEFTAPNRPVSVTKEFYDLMCDVLWESYCPHYEPVEE